MRREWGIAFIPGGKRYMGEIGKRPKDGGMAQEEREEGTLH